MGQCQRRPAASQRCLLEVLQMQWDVPWSKESNMYTDPETQRPEGGPLHQEHEAVGYQAQQDCADLRPAVPVCNLLGPDLWRRPAGQWPEGGQPEAEDPSGGVCSCLLRSSSCWKALSWGQMARSHLTPSSCTHQHPGQAQAGPLGPAAPPSAGVQM